MCVGSSDSKFKRDVYCPFARGKQKGTEMKQQYGNWSEHFE